MESLWVWRERRCLNVLENLLDKEWQQMISRFEEDLAVCNSSHSVGLPQSNQTNFMHNEIDGNKGLLCQKNLPGRSITELFAERGIESEQEVARNFYNQLSSAYEKMRQFYGYGDTKQRFLGKLDLEFIGSKLHPNIILHYDILEIVKKVYRIQENIKYLEIQHVFLNELRGPGFNVTDKEKEYQRIKQDLYCEINVLLARLANLKPEKEGEFSQSEIKIIREVEIMVNRVFNEFRKEERELMVSVTHLEAESLGLLTDKVEACVNKHWDRVSKEVAKGGEKQVARAMAFLYGQLTELLCESGMKRKDIAQYFILYFQRKKIDLGKINAGFYHYLMDEVSEPNLVQFREKRSYSPLHKLKNLLKTCGNCIPFLGKMISESEFCSLENLLLREIEKLKMLPV